MNQEPSMDQIEDYNNNESPQKRKTVILVIVGCLVIGAILAGLKYKFNYTDDYVGTPQNPGINTTKNY